MSEEFLTITHPAHSLEDELNRRGREGWLVVNCWSAGSGEAMCVLKRRREYWCADTQSFQPCRSLGLLDLSVALARCQGKRARAGKNPAIPLEELGAEFGSNQEEVFEQLKTAGLEESPKLPDAHSAFSEGFLLFVSKNPDKAGRLWLHIKPVKQQRKGASSQEQASTQGIEREPSPPPSSEEPAPELPTIDDLIHCCAQQPVTRAGWPHSISLPSLAETFGCDTPTIESIILAAGVPLKASDPKKPYVFVKDKLVGLKQSGPTFYLNLKPKPAKR